MSYIIFREACIAITTRPSYAVMLLSWTISGIFFLNHIIDASPADNIRIARLAVGYALLMSVFPVILPISIRPFLARGFREMLFVRPIGRGNILWSLTAACAAAFAAVSIVIHISLLILKGNESIVDPAAVLAGPFYFTVIFLSVYALILFLTIVLTDFQLIHMSVVFLLAMVFIGFTSFSFTSMERIGSMEQNTPMMIAAMVVYYLTPPVYESMLQYIYQISGGTYSLRPLLHGCAVAAAYITGASVILKRRDL